MYRDRLKGVQILLSNSQAGQGRKVKQEQEDISCNHVQIFICLSIRVASSMTSAFWLSGEFANKREDRTDHVIRNTFVEDEIRYDKIQAA